MNFEVKRHPKYRYISKGIYMHALPENGRRFFYGEHGWKIHVSSSHRNPRGTLKCVSDFCHQNGVQYKYIRKYKDFAFNISPMANPPDSGKFITVYPESLEKMKEIIPKLNAITASLEGIFILSDSRYLESSSVFYRYGLIVSNIVKEDVSMLHEGEKYYDYKRPYFSPPSFAVDPFPRTKNAESNFLFKRYPKIKLIAMNNAGGVFDTGEGTVIKAARKGIGFSLTRNCQFSKENEKHVCKRAKGKHFPKYVNDYWVEDDYFIETTKMKGVSLRVLKDIIDPVITDLSSVERTKKLKSITLASICLLIEASDQGLFLNDIAPRNLLWDEYTGDISFVDLEWSWFDDWVNERDFMVTSKTWMDSRSLKKRGYSFFKERQKMGYALMELFSDSNNYLCKDKTGRMSWEHFSFFAQELGLTSSVVCTVEKLISNSTIGTERLKELNKELIEGSDSLLWTLRAEQLDSLRSKAARIKELAAASAIKVTTCTSLSDCIIFSLAASDLKKIKTSDSSSDFCRIFAEICEGGEKNMKAAKRDCEELCQKLEEYSGKWYLRKDNLLWPGIDEGAIGVLALLSFFQKKFDLSAFAEWTDRLKSWCDVKLWVKVSVGEGYGGVLGLTMFLDYLGKTKFSSANYSLERIAPILLATHVKGTRLRFVDKYSVVLAGKKEAALKRIVFEWMRRIPQVP